MNKFIETFICYSLVASVLALPIILILALWGIFPGEIIDKMIGTDFLSTIAFYLGVMLL